MHIKKQKKVLLYCALTGLAIPVAFGIISETTRNWPSREMLLQPFFLLSSPVFAFGEYVFGQAPVPILLLLVCYWLLVGLFWGILMVTIVGVWRRKAG